MNKEDVKGFIGKVAYDMQVEPLLEYGFSEDDPENTSIETVTLQQYPLNMELDLEKATFYKKSNHAKTLPYSTPPAELFSYIEQHLRKEIEMTKKIMTPATPRKKKRLSTSDWANPVNIDWSRNANGDWAQAFRQAEAEWPPQPGEPQPEGPQPEGRPVERPDANLRRVALGNLNADAPGIPDGGEVVEEEIVRRDRRNRRRLFQEDEIEPEQLQAIAQEARAFRLATAPDGRLMVNGEELPEGVGGFGYAPEVANVVGNFAAAAAEVRVNVQGDNLVVGRPVREPEGEIAGVRNDEVVEPEIGVDFEAHNPFEFDAPEPENEENPEAGVQNWVVEQDQEEEGPRREDELLEDEEELLDDEGEGFGEVLN